MELAPIVIFVYNRPLHTKRTLDALAQNAEAKESELYIFCDGAKPGASEVLKQSIEEVRSIVRAETRFKNSVISEQEDNKGLAASIVQGVSSILNKYDTVIVLEDDLVVSKTFLSYMNNALNKYRHQPDVACISGYVYPLKKKFTEAFFIRGADCWGWATWKDKWTLFNNNPQQLQSEIKSRGLESEFDFNNSYPYCAMLADRIAGKNQSWAVLWYASAFLQNKLCLYPSTSLVQNIGKDGSGTHYKTSIVESPAQFNNDTNITLPDDIRENHIARKEIENFFNSSKPNLVKRIVKSLLRRGKRLFRNKSNNHFSGDYASWNEALKKTSGYDSLLILEKVSNAIQKVKNGEAAYERDSVVFSEYAYSENVRSAILETVPKNNGHIVDFGGSLGSLYFQYKRFLDNQKFTWTVVEQSHFVNYGKQHLQDDELKFAITLQEANEHLKPHLLIASSVLCYLEKPYEWIEKFIETQADYILIDRTAFIEGEKERITIQTVPEEIYKASYPVWFLNEQKFISAFLNQYELVRELPDTIDGEDIVDGKRGYRKGFLFRKKS